MLLKSDERRRLPALAGALAVGLAFLMTALPLAGRQAAAAEAEESGSALHLSLDDALGIALERNHEQAISRHAVEAAEAQHRQALAAYWPRLDINAWYAHLDEDPNFIFPGETIELPGFTYQSPDRDIKLMDQELGVASLELTYPLYAGGRRAAAADRARWGLEAARQSSRRTELQVIRDVKRMYYGAILARELQRVGEEALVRLEVTLKLTEELYLHGSGVVKKTDYLRNKVVVEEARALVAELERNTALARAALVNTLGLEWNREVVLTEACLPYEPYEATAEQLINGAVRFSPDWAALEAGTEAAEARVREQKSGQRPALVLFGQLATIANDYDMGIVTPTNKDSYRVGLALRIPIFDGMLAKNRIREARARLAQMEPKKMMLREGIALQVKDALLKATAAQRQQEATLAALAAARENRSLNERAYREGLVETRDVIQAQIIESLAEAQHQRVLFGHLESRAQLDYVVGREVLELLE